MTLLRITRKNTQYNSVTENIPNKVSSNPEPSLEGSIFVNLLEKDLNPSLSSYINTLIKNLNSELYFSLAGLPMWDYLPCLLMNSCQ